ncbi:DUF4214 domain-containing protein [Pseudochelatococcus sp. B33]
MAQNYNSGDNLPPGIDILFVGEDSESAIRLPSDVPVAIFETETGRTITIDGQLPVVVAGGSGDDLIYAGLAQGEAERTFFGGDGNDTIIGSDFGDTFIDGAGDDVYEGGAGDDEFYLVSGSDTVKAGDGFDVINFADFVNNVEASNVAAGDDEGGADNSWQDQLASRENYSLEWNGKTAIVINLETQDTLEITDAEYLKWSDSVVVVASDEDQGAVARLYEALFDRSGEVDGIKYWFDLHENGASLYEIASRFLDVEEADNLRGLSNEEFVDHLYLNTLDREADAEGREYWVNLLNETGDRAQVAASFIHEQESQEKTADVIHIITDEDNDLLS